jgi:hypothetical protein
MSKITASLLVTLSLMLYGCGPSACDCAAMKGQTILHGTYHIWGKEIKASSEDEKRYELLMKCVDKYSSLNAAERECKK